MAAFPDTYPTTFSEELEPLEAFILDSAGQQALGAIAAEGFGVDIGLRRSDIPEIRRIANQERVKKYCLGDSISRFIDEPTTEEWLHGGRGMLLLRDREVTTDKLYGYGWTGLKSSEYVPGGMTTFAVRLDERLRGRGLGKHFTTVIVSGSAALFGAQGVWLETWKSNPNAVRAYGESGAVWVGEHEGKRPTGPNSNVSDVRVIMKFPNTFAQGVDTF